MAEISRRWLIGGAAVGLTAAGLGGGYVLVDAGVLPGRSFLARRLGRCGSMPALPKTRPGRQVSTTYEGNRLVVGHPPSPRTGVRPPVVLMFHGAAGDARTPFDRYGVQYYWPADASFVLVAMDHWKPYDTVTRDLLPYLQSQGLSTERIGLLGWSMGGHGVLEYAASLGRRRVFAVATASAAIDGGDVPGLAKKLRGIPAHITCGRDDSYAEANADLLAALGKSASGGLSAGCHDTAFRRRMLRAQMEFFATWSVRG